MIGAGSERTGAISNGSIQFGLGCRRAAANGVAPQYSCREGDAAGERLVMLTAPLVAQFVSKAT
jgi:hypothetical protein